MTARFAAVLVAVLVLRVWASSSPAPQRLSETGLYLPGTLTVDPVNRPFAPQYPLWSDGMRKSRWVRLPFGTQIDARDVDNWAFPVGTRFWKEFVQDGRRVETRMLWRSSADEWVYATYVWNETQTDASLAPSEGVPGVVDLAPGKRHSIPSRTDCLTCHENGGAPVLGFTALQLSSDRDPLAPNPEPLQPAMLTLQTLLDEQLLSPAHAELAARPPRIPGDPRTRAALGYLTANCGHCHNDRSTVATVRFPLRMPTYASSEDVAQTIDALLARTTKWDLPHTPSGTTALVSAGTPDLSALFARMRSRRPSTQMPPLGTVMPDHQALDLVSAWIRDLPRRKP
ncbi:MAG TPA: hypothetical protein VGD94_18080 [Vicinamibacterales bacterium]